MQPPHVARFGFRIRTRQGIVVDSVVIPARDELDAERRVRQIYRDCDILGRFPGGHAVCEAPSFEDIATRIAR